MRIAEHVGWLQIGSHPAETLTVHLPWLVVSVAGSAVALAPPVSPRVRALPLFASVVLLGLPHGAVDHLALPRVRDERASRDWLLRVGLLYLVLGAAYAVVWFLAPAVGVVSFVLLTWFHWGQGDLFVVADAGHLRTRPQRALVLVVRGGLPMLVPLLSHPRRYRAVVTEILGLFEAGIGPLETLVRDDVRLALGIGFAALVAVALAVGLRRTPDRRPWAIDAGEVVLLWAFFWVVPPLFAIGLYFAAWHSPRHVARLLGVDPASTSEETALAALARFAREAAPLTLLSLAVLAGLYVVVPEPPPPTDVPGLVALYLVFVAVLTLPHVAVVTEMDRRQGVWTPD